MTSAIRRQSTDHGASEAKRMVVYRTVPYLVIAAPPAILLLTILIGG